MLSWTDAEQDYKPCTGAAAWQPLWCCLQLKHITMQAWTLTGIAPVTGWMRWGFLIFQVRPAWGSVQRLACCSLCSSVSTALKPLPKGFISTGSFSMLVCTSTLYLRGLGANGACLCLQSQLEHA